MQEKPAMITGEEIAEQSTKIDTVLQRLKDAQAAIRTLEDQKQKAIGQLSLALPQMQDQMRDLQLSIGVPEAELVEVKTSSDALKIIHEAYIFNNQKIEETENWLQTVMPEIDRLKNIFANSAQ